MQEIMLTLPVKTNASSSPEEIARIVKRLIDIGLADATATIEDSGNSDDGDVAAAEMAVSLHIGAPEPKACTQAQGRIVAKTMHTALTTLLTQAEQMRSMFDDDDGEIQKAIAAAELAAANFEAVEGTYITRMDSADRFIQELHQEYESLSGISEALGMPTLSMLMYLHVAILRNGFITVERHDPPITDIVKGLPSGHEWVKYIRTT